MRPELTLHREFIDLRWRRAPPVAQPHQHRQVNELSTDGGDYFMVLEYLEA
jgi:hypothetical protein